MIGSQKTPVFKKRLLDLGNDGTKQTKMHIGHTMRITAICSHMPVADIHTARKRNFAVHHQNLAVIAQIDIKRRRDERRRNKPRHFHAELD